MTVEYRATRRPLEMQRGSCHPKCARNFSALSRNGLLVLKSPQTVRAYFGYHNSLYIFATPRL